MLHRSSHRRRPLALSLGAVSLGAVSLGMVGLGAAGLGLALTGAGIPAGVTLMVLALAALSVQRELRLRRALTTLEDERARNDALAHQAAHDPLTGVLNRQAFLARLEFALARARLHHRSLAVLFLDLDGFKQVNDVLGHDVGDRMLSRVAERLLACVRSADVVARFGGDEFVVLLEDLADQEQAFDVAERLHVALAVPFVVDGRRLTIGASIGVTISVGGREAARALVREADTAMYLAKRNGALDLDVLAGAPSKGAPGTRGDTGPGTWADTRPDAFHAALPDALHDALAG